MNVKHRYLKRLRRQSHQTDKGVAKILGEYDAAINRRHEMGLADRRVTSRSRELYLFMLKCHSVRHENGNQRLTGLNHHQLLIFKRRFHVNDRSLALSLKQIRKL